jgi:hypothetical protein
MTGISSLWTSRKEKERRRIATLRSRDGEDCRRCRRPLRFDLPSGHDLAPKIEPMAVDAKADELEQMCLTHWRCNPSMLDHTGEVLDRVRRKAEAELLAKPKRRKRAAGAR